ncbi:PREDICTED: mitochondrial 2-oxodicarboxylate carrier [Nicrophorus vespilloides]|uniref:Mitochondrial 2-oxodicarboxylate carrier n=1 Tax=Nicrophorus vespilloides TaxID=110193 RepID=A0ABM1NC97_NICVS|nr:PREDICTED: mitochondrial 2-oxodicarboxylate carrier [Nicrophorus vespilloides]
MEDVRKIMKEALIQIGSGGSAGFVEVCIMHPLDLVKTRLQIQSNVVLTSNDPKYYSGIVDCFQKMYKHEGMFSFWKGILPPILAETPKRAVKFFTFEQYKQFFMFGSPVPTPLTFSLAGLGAGITEAILVNPFEVVKVTMQANRASGKEVPSTWLVTKDIVRTQGFGFRGLNKGVTATISRNGVFNMVYFGFYHSVKGYMTEYKDPYKEFGRKVGIGFVSGTLASCINIPFDVAKSRIQGPQPIPGAIKYKSTLGSLCLVYKEEGILALYKGLLPKVLRLGPGGAIMLVVYDYMHQFLTKTYPN